MLNLFLGWIVRALHINQEPFSGGEIYLERDVQVQAHLFIFLEAQVNLHYMVALCLFTWNL